MIKYLKGDATELQVDNGLRILCHIVNNKNKWGKGFVLALSAKWPQPEQAYREWASFNNNFCLGQVQLVPVNDKYGKLYIANMVAQDGFAGMNNPVAVHYDALNECFCQLNEWIKSFLYVKELMWRGVKRFHLFLFICP